MFYINLYRLACKPCPHWRLRPQSPKTATIASATIVDVFGDYSPVWRGIQRATQAHSQPQLFFGGQEGSRRICFAGVWIKFGAAAYAIYGYCRFQLIQMVFVRFFFGGGRTNMGPKPSPCYVRRTTEKSASCFEGCLWFCKGEMRSYSQALSSLSFLYCYLHSVGF